MSMIRFDNTKSGTANDLVEKISREVPRSVQVDTLIQTYPNGKIRGTDFLLGSLAGEAGESLKIDINPNSPHFMRGQDFNGGEGIGGIVKILMAARGMRLPEIKEMFGSYLTDNVVYSPDWKTSKGINLNTIPVQSYTNGVEPAELEKVRIDINT